MSNPQTTELSRDEKLKLGFMRIKNRCAGDRVPNWADDWQTTHSRGLILDICDAALEELKDVG